MNRLSPHTLLVLLGLLSTTALGAATPQGRLREEAEGKARAEVGDLLRTLCPEQCVLVSVEARVEEEAIGTAPPGFETLSGGATLPTLRMVSAHVVVDSRLPGPFRTRLKDLVAQRLKGVGPQPTVNVESVAFPPRNAPHLEAPPLEQKPQPAPPTPSTEPEAEAKEVPTMGERLLEKLLDAAPLLAVVVLLALTVMVLGALMVLAARRPPPPPPLDYLPEEPLPAAEPPAPATPTPPEYPAVRARRLERAYTIPTRRPSSMTSRRPTPERCIAASAWQTPASGVVVRAGALMSSRAVRPRALRRWTRDVRPCVRSCDSVGSDSSWQVRSEPLTTPSTRPSRSTTGTAVMPCPTRSSAICLKGVSGCTVST